MIGPTNARGGGGGLNLKVVGGTTQPANPRENTIWINTATAITGYALSPTQPQTGTEGLVWLKTAGTGVEINVGRKNAVLLHLASGMLYTGASWKDVECSAFSNGVWTQFSFLRIYLYNAGDQCVALTGGWKIVNHGGGTSKLLDGYIEVSHSGGNNRISNIHTVSKVNITGYSKLCAELEVADVEDSRGTSFGLGTGLVLQGGEFTAKTVIKKPSDGPTIVSVDISSAKSNYVIFYAENTTAKISAVWLER